MEQYLLAYNRANIASFLHFKELLTMETMEGISMFGEAIKFDAAVRALAFGAVVMSSVANATEPVISVGSGPAGASVYENFDGLASSGGLSANGIHVTFSGTGARTAALPDLSGYYAAPYLSDGSGAAFGNLQADGKNATQYLTTGIGQVTLQLEGYSQYLGLLWGSVDDYNKLSFYNGNTLLFSFTGLDVDAGANGNQGAGGTFYVNINSDVAFNKVVASSTAYGFELDNVALAIHPLAVSPIPEPEAYSLLMAGLVLIGAMVRRRSITSIVRAC
jgi:hypothetical protein